VTTAPSLVSVVIPTRNGGTRLGEVLEALRLQECPFQVEIVAVDSGSCDETLEQLARSRVRVQRVPPGDFDHGETRNLGIRLSRGDPVVLLSQDAVPADRSFLRELVRPFADPRVAGAYGRQIPRADCDVATRRRLARGPAGRTAPALARLDGGRLSDLPPAEQLALCTLDNVCSALRRAVWEAIAFPRTDFGEDVAWGRAVISAGWALAYTPAAAVVHSHRRSLGDEYRRMRLDHRRLHELFGLALVPRWRDVLRASAANLRSDLPDTWRAAGLSAEGARRLLRAACLAVATPVAQYQGRRDARRPAARA
jgi:rhamnosyltransferase